MKIYLLVPLCFFFLRSDAQNAEVVYENTVNSTLTIETEDGLGSGFFIAKNIIVTNYHVVKNSVHAYCYSNKSQNRYKIDGYIAVDKQNDLVLLKISGLNKPPLKFATTAIKTGQNIFVIGSPRGLPATISNGIISGLRDFGSSDLIQITAPISPGSSGGPVLNSQGQLIGVSVSQLMEGQNLNFAIPCKYLKVLISKISDVKQLMYLDEERVAALKNSVKIGSKLWMSSNLNVSRFRNGDPIAEARSNEEWVKAGEEGKPAWCYYDNDPASGEKYGKLYNWYAIIDRRGLAPIGWRVSTYLDWKEIVAEIGEENVGSEIKTFYGWEEGNGTNMRAFNAQPSGWRLFNGYFKSVGTNAYWWTTNQIDATLAVYICLLQNSNYTRNPMFSRYSRLLDKLDEINSYKGGKSFGLSVRCVKD